MAKTTLVVTAKTTTHALPPAVAEPEPAASPDEETPEDTPTGASFADLPVALDASVTTSDASSGSEQAAPAVDDLVLAGRKRREEAEQAARFRESLRRVQITVYFAEWCPVCTQARRWLTARGYAYSEKDVEKDPSAKEAYLQLNSRGSIPTITIDGQVVVGFRERTVANAIDRAARKRLGL